MIAIIDYGMGNLASVKKSLDFLKIPCEITNDHQVIRKSSAIILPGVGSFQQGMRQLKRLGLDVVMTEEVIDKRKKFLGICLGMQLIFSIGTEPVENEGLNWIQGKVVKMEFNDLKIPHMGWNTLNCTPESALSDADKEDVYFIHSYHVQPTDESVISVTVDYGDALVAGIQKDNIMATQFHPEKSQKAGLAILKSYFSDHVKG